MTPHQLRQMRAAFGRVHAELRYWTTEHRIWCARSMDDCAPCHRFIAARISNRGYVTPEEVSSASALLRVGLSGRQ